MYIVIVNRHYRKAACINRILSAVEQSTATRRTAAQPHSHTAAQPHNAQRTPHAAQPHAFTPLPTCLPGF